MTPLFSIPTEVTKKGLGFLGGVLLCSLIGLHSSAYAQTIAPPDLKFICGSVRSSTKSIHCVLQVPADLIGASFDIQLKKGKATGIQNLKKGDSLPGSGLFFQLEATDQGHQYLIQIDYGDMKAMALGAAPYALFQFDLELSFSGSSDFPMVIPAPLKGGGQLYTPSSIALNQSSFRATNDVPLEIHIAELTDEDPVMKNSSIDFSFKFAGDTDGLEVIPGFYCFDDPIDSMTKAEWVIICDAKKRGIVSGNPLPTGIFFFPNQPINRAEAVKIVTLGILRSMGKLSDADFTNEEQMIRKSFPREKHITYPDIEYEMNGEPPWFGVFVNIASEQKIVHGYPHDGTYKAINKINNAESYRVIVETGRVASDAIAKALETATKRSSLRTEDWFLKYANTLDGYNIKFSKEYEKFTSRKDFLILVMELLAAVGL